MKSEEHIEKPLHACEDSDQRGELLEMYRQTVGFGYRYYDDE